MAGKGRTCAPAAAVAVAVAKAAAGPWGGGGCSPGGGAPPARSKFSIRKLLPRLPKPGAAGKLRSAEEATTSQYAPAWAATALGSMVSCPPALARPGKEDGAPRTPAGLERYYLFGSVVFLKDGRSECGRGKPCVSRARGVSSGGAGGVPPAFYADGTGFFLLRLEGWKVCPAHPFMSLGPQSDRRGQQ